MDRFLTLESLSFLLAFGLSALAIPFARRLARRTGFVDRPGGRKDHMRDTPPVGGLVIVPVAVIVALWFGAMELPRDAAFLGAVGLLLVLGIVDDARGLPAGLKFTVQGVSAALIVVPGGAVIHSMGDLFGLGAVHLGPFAVPLTIFCVALLINAINMIDGLDGLAGGVVLGALVWIVVATGGAGDSRLALAVAGGVAGFLIYNTRNPWRRKACVFLGDSGSMALGLTLAWLCIRASQGAGASLSPVAVAWILGVPVMDAFALFVTRLRRGRHPFSADRRHFHHRFTDAGMASGAVSAGMVGLSAIFGGKGVLGIRLGVPEPVLMAVWVVLLLVNTAACFWHVRFVETLAARRGLKGLKPANDVDHPLVDAHGQNCNENAQLQRNP
ncbi:MAG TPA: MraY family glycosyltransferase [Alphaproteobacteria bacterium]|nr:MraY family glycosyltransferase [Alphaproteobacteria bacterium]